MKRILPLLLSATLLIAAAAPAAHAARPLTMDELKRVLHDPSKAKAGGMPSLLEDVIGKPRADATIKSMQPATVPASGLLPPIGWCGPGSPWNSGGDFYGKAYRTFQEAAAAVLAYHMTHGEYPANFYYLDGEMYCRGVWNRATGYYEISYYDDQNWISLFPYSP